MFLSCYPSSASITHISNAKTDTQAVLSRMSAHKYQFETGKKEDGYCLIDRNEFLHSCQPFASFFCPATYAFINSGQYTHFSYNR